MRPFQSSFPFEMSAPPAPKKARRSEISRMQDESVLCDDDDESDSPFTLYFIRLTDANVTDEEMKNFNACYEEALAGAVCPEWIDAEEVEKLQTSNDFFVVPCFRGKLFWKIQARHLKVYGPPIVLECLRGPKVLPHWGHAIYSSVFDGAKISFTCVEKKRRDELVEKVGWMSGIVGATLYHESTHLVCGKAEQTEKYSAAVKNGIKLMKVEWINDLWEASKTTMGQFSALSNDAVTAYTLRTFEGVVMAVTSIDGADRTNLMQLVEEHGGQIPGNMAKSRCTHLITDQTKGQKYTKAMEWKINVVQTRWIKKCIDLGHLVDERKYHPSLMSLEKLRSSTPKKNANVTESGPDVSSIAGHGGRLSISSFSASVLTPNSSTIFGHRNRPSNASVASSSTSNVACSVINNDITIQGPIRRKSDQFATPVVRTTATPLIRHPTNQNIAPAPAFHDPIDELRTQVEGLDDLFENCMVYLCGVAENQKEKWWRFLNQTGASRVRKFESATNVIVLAPSQEEKMTIRKFLNHDDIAIVSVNWVVECVKQKRVVSHEDFEWTENQPEESQSQGSQPANPSSSLSRHTSVMSCKTVLTSFSEPPPVQAAGIFGTHTYSIHHSIHPNAVPKLQEQLKNNGGIIEANEDSAEFVVCAHSYPLHELLAFDIVITDLYVETCIMSGQRFKLSDHALFVPLPRPPIPVFNQKTFFLQCSISSLRNYVKTIIESRGGTVTDDVDSKKAVIVIMERCTVPPQYRSRNVVDLSLIVASMSECRVQSITDHLYVDDTEPLHGYQREDDVWSKSLREKDTTQEIEELEREEERMRAREQVEVEQERENRGRITPLENPYFPDLRKPYKMNLHLDGVSEIINNMPSPSQETQDSLTTSRIGSILRKAVYNTGLQREDTTEAMVSRPPSAVIAENRRTVSSTPVLQRKQDRRRQVEKDESFVEQNQEHVEELNRRYAMHPHFLLSISELPQEQQDQIITGIQQLGGVIDKEFNPDIANLITARLIRTPKTLSAIAAGRWCLTPEYVHKSVAAGHWLDEQPYEWNLSKLSLSEVPEGSKSSSARLMDIERNLARVCSEWRVRVARMPITCSVDLAKRHNGAFSGWRCIAHEADKKTRPVLPILEAGGAQVHTITEYVEVANHSPTIAFAAKDFDWNVQSAALLKRQRVPLYEFEYIYQFLVKKENQDLSKFLHPNFRNA